jgi:hypothetical protein
MKLCRILKQFDALFCALIDEARPKFRPWAECYEGFRLQLSPLNA